MIDNNPTFNSLSVLLKFFHYYRIVTQLDICIITIKRYEKFCNPFLFIFFFLIR